MIGYIKGQITACEEGVITIENGGIGYEVHVSNITEFSGMSGSNEQITIYTSMLVREDDISLCGFKTKADLVMFKKLLTVNGVGAKVALAVLSVMKADALSKAIVFEDVDSIVRAPGIGKKTAQRIVLELKDKLGDISGFSAQETSFASVETELSGAADAKTEAMQALVALGYSRAESAAVLSKINEEFDNSQDYIKIALSKLI